MFYDPMNGAPMTVSSPISKVKRWNRALTLVEVMVSFALLLVVATSVMHGFILSRRTAGSTIQQSISTDVAQGFLEQIKMMGYESLRDVIDNPETVPLSTYWPEISHVSSSMKPFPMYVGKVHDLPVALDIDRLAKTSSFSLKIRPELRDLFDTADALPAIEVTLHYSYVARSRVIGNVIKGRRVQYVVPNLGSTKSEP